MSFTAIRDQETAIRLLRNLTRSRRVPNGLLFWGPSGVGKGLAAAEFIKALNCREGGDDACDACLLCRKITRGNHPDVKTIVPSGKARMIVMDQIDDLMEYAGLRPFESTWRVVIIQDADRMNLSAQNHFLKTLEEPPGRAIFILLTAHPRMLLPTIRSRCQMVRFQRLRPQTVAELIERDRGVTGEIAEAIAHLSEGQMSRALDLIDSEKRNVALDIVHRLATGEDPSALAEEFSGLLDDQRKRLEAQVDEELKPDRADEATREELEALKELRMAHMAALVKRELMEYLYLFQTWYRDELVFKATGDPARVLNRDQVARLREASSAPADKIKAVESALMQLNRNINEERVFRVLFFSLAEK